MYVKVSRNNYNYRNKVIFMEQSFLITLFYSRDFPVVEYFKVSNFYHTLPVLEIWCIIRKALRKTVRVMLVTYSLLNKSKPHTLSTCNHLKINQTVLVGHLGSLSSYRRGRHLQESIYIPLYGKLAISLELVLKSYNTYTVEIYLDLLCIILLLSHLKKKQTFPWTVDMFNFSAGYLSWCSLLWSRQFLCILWWFLEYRKDLYMNFLQNIVLYKSFIYALTRVA